MTATASCVPGAEKYRQTLNGSAGRIEDMGFEVKQYTTQDDKDKCPNLSETYLPNLPSQKPRVVLLKKVFDAVIFHSGHSRSQNCHFPYVVFRITRSRFIQ